MIKKKKKQNILINVSISLICYLLIISLCILTVNQNIVNKKALNWEKVDIVKISESVSTEYIQSKSKGYNTQTKYEYSIIYRISNVQKEMVIMLYNDRLDPIALRINPKNKNVYLIHELKTWDYTIRFASVFILAIFAFIFTSEYIKIKKIIVNK